MCSLAINKVEGGTVDQIYQHQLSDGSKSNGLLHFYKKDDQWHFVSSADYEAKKTELPDLCFAIKCPIEKISEKEWPDLLALADDVLDKEATSVEHETKDSISDEVIKGPRYHTRCQINHEEIEVNHSESQVTLDSKYSIHPLIFYRLAKPLKKEKELPPFDLTKFYKTDSKHHIDFVFVPELQNKKNNALIAKTKEAWDELDANFKQFDPKFKKEMLKELNDDIKGKIGSYIMDFELEGNVTYNDMKFEDKDLKKLSEKVKK